jgi:hypothetical protein
MALFEGQKIWRLTILKKLRGQKVLARCECSAVLECFEYSIRTGRRRACQRCTMLEKKMQHEIEAAKAAVLAGGGRLPLEVSTKRWEWEGDSEGLAKMLERSEER